MCEELKKGEIKAYEGWQNPSFLSPEAQLEVLEVSLKEPLTTYHSDFRCLGEWKDCCGKLQRVTRRCILGGFCQFWSKYHQSSIYLTSPGPLDSKFWKRNKLLWRINVNRVWEDFITNIVLWNWAIIFYNLNTASEEEVDDQIDLFLDQPEVRELLDLEGIVEKLQTGKVIKVDLGVQDFEGKKSLLLTIEKGLVFGIEGKARDYNIADFLLTLKRWKFKIQKQQLIKHLQNWFFDRHTDPRNQQKWIRDTFIKVRENSFRLLQLEKKHPFGLLFRDWKSKFTPAALTLTILCNEAQRHIWQTLEEKEFSFQVLEKIYELQRLTNEGRTFWDNWRQLLSYHIATLIPGIIFFSRKEKVPVKAEKWVELLIPLKESYFSLLFWVTEHHHHKEKILEVLQEEIDSLINCHYLSPTGAVNREKFFQTQKQSDPITSWIPLKRELKRLDKEINW
jgi:hypothetical protein